MTLLKQAKLYLIYVSVSPWVMAFLNENILPSGGAYDWAKGASLFIWLIIMFLGGGHLFIENGEEIMKELRGPNDR